MRAVLEVALPIPVMAEIESIDLPVVGAGESLAAKAIEGSVQGGHVGGAGDADPVDIGIDGALVRIGVDAYGGRRILGAQARYANLRQKRRREKKAAKFYALPLC